MGAIFADVSFGVSSSNPDNTSQIQAAIAAACEANTQVIFPAGDLKFSQDIVLPNGFVGTLGIAGLGKKITRFVPIGGSNGFNFNLSAGTAANNSVDLSNFGLVANSAAKTALSISYGTGSLGSVENQPGSSISNLAIYGGGWISGLSLTNCWHADIDGLYIYGNMNGYTTNNGVGISITSCYNSTFNRITTEFFTKGITLRSLQSFGGDSQGIFIDNLQMVECVNGIYAYGTPANYLSTLIISNWMVDNGNINVPGHRSIVIDNGEDCIIGKGQGLQNGGDSQIIFNSCRACKIDPLVSLEFRANTTGPAIQDNNGNGNITGQITGPQGPIGPSGASIVGPQGPAGKGFWSFL